MNYIYYFLHYFMNQYFWVSYSIWVLIFIMWIIYLIKQISRSHFPKFIAFNFVPFLTFLFFTYVFIINNGSNVAQFVVGNDTAKKMWVLWLHLFEPLYFVNVASGAGIIIALFFPPYPPQQWALFILKILILLTITISFCFLMVFAPTA